MADFKPHMKIFDLLKESTKYIGVVVIVLLIFYVGGVGGYQAKQYVEQQKVIKQIVEHYSNVIGQVEGGTTPEETYNLFVDALKKEDVKLAVKYVISAATTRQEYYDEFIALKNNNELKAYAEAFPSWDKMDKIQDEYNDWEDRATVEYGEKIDEPIEVYDPYLKKETTVKPGIYGHSIIFEKEKTNLWRILQI